MFFERSDLPVKRYTVLVQEDAKSYLQQKAKQLDLGRGKALQTVQELLDDRYQKRIRAISLNDGVLKIITPSAGLANNLRLEQIQLIKDLEQAIGWRYHITRLIIRISTIAD